MKIQSDTAKTTQSIPSDMAGEGLRKSGDDYYMMVAVQKSAGGGPSWTKVDSALAEIISSAMGSGGRIGVEEAHRIMAKITDGGRYGKGEEALTRMLLAACDDRKDVMLMGVRVNITPPAEQVFEIGLPRWWGSLSS